MRRFTPGKPHPVLEGLSTKLIAEMCRVTERTVRRWKNGEEPSHAALQLIKLLTTGDLGVVGWKGWKVKGDQLISEDGEQVTRGEIRSIPFMRMQIRAYQTDQRLPRQADFVDQKWQPSDVTEAAG